MESCLKITVTYKDFLLIFFLDNMSTGYKIDFSFRHMSRNYGFPIYQWN